MSEDALYPSIMIDESTLQQFQQFVGKKVGVDVQTMEFKSNRGDGEPVKYDSYQIADGDETMRDIRVLAERSDAMLRVWLPNTRGTMDFRRDRLNVTITKGDDGTYTVTKAYVG